ncbi:MAG TPA: DUF6049 family protein [Actinomycetota bacterium]|nr:DUF6049 family protein [Actinomycetota bacterium]
MRRLAASILISGLLAAVWPATGAAQPRPGARLALLEHSPAVSGRDRFQISVVVSNPGKRPLRSAGATLWIYNPARSRTAYRAALTGEPSVGPVLVAPFRERITLAPGEQRVIRLERRLDELAARGETALHPLKVQLEDFDGVAIAQVRSAVMFVHERPEVPLNLGVTVVLDEPVLYRPDGALLDDSLARSVSPGGRLDELVSAVEASPVELTLVISPLLIEELGRMSRGFRIATTAGTRSVAPRDDAARSAGALLQRIRGVVATPLVEVVPLPLATPSIPALIRAGLRDDVESQIVRGRAILEALLPRATFTEGVTYPPGGDLTPRAVRALSRMGTTTLLVGEDALVAGPASPLTGAPVADAAAGRGVAVRAVVPDAGVQQLLAEVRRGPSVRAQHATGELAAIWLEQPGTSRGVAVLFPGYSETDPALLRAFLGLVRRSSPDEGAGWIRPIKASELARAESAPRRAVRRSVVPSLSPLFVNGLTAAARAIAQLEDVTRRDLPLVERLKRLLLVAESRHYTVREHRGLALLRAIRDRVEQEFDKLELPSGTAVTLTSRRGLIPITMGSRAEFPIRVRVRLVSPRLRFLEGGPKTLVLDRPREAFTFPVLAHTTGRFPVRILLETPKGSPIAESQIVVRSTAYNTRALLVVIAATLFLIVLWGRRLLSAR